MQRIYTILLFLIGMVCYSQTITVDNATNSPTDLVNLLIGNSCVEVSNISSSSPQAVAYFNRNASGFPITEGIIIRSGNAVDTQGSYTGNNLGSTANGGGTDPFLQNLSNTSSGTTSALTDLAFLEFDFTTISTSLSFDFIFASNEYGQFQCLSNDIFAFELTNLTTGVTTNLALIPNTSNPVSVKYIKDAQYNNSCSSTNPSLFSVYNVNNPAASTLNMRGHTVVLNASAAIIPNNPYRLKMVIADYVSSNFDSAVFIAGGSFNTTIDLGADRTICTGDEFDLTTGLDATYNHQWFLNGNPIPGAVNATYTVTQAGTYTVEATKGSCLVTDTIVFTDLAVTNPINLSTCNNGSASYPYNLTLNNETQLGIDPAIYDVVYYASLADANANNPIATPNPYMSPGNETVFIKIFNTQTGNFCDAVYQFDLQLIASVNAGNNIADTLCDNPNGQNYTLTGLDPQVLNGQNAADFIISYYNSQSEAQQGINSIGTSILIPAGTTTLTVWIRLEAIGNASCFDVTSATITVNPLPVVSDIPDPVECSSFTLPAITDGNYFTFPGGPTTPGQIPLFAGDVIPDGGTYYIFAGPDANGCTNETFFALTLIDEYIPSLDNCGSFTVPLPPYSIGAFYTAAGGPSGGGTLIPEGTVFTNNTAATITQNMFYYAEVNGVPCVDRLFAINIHPVPLTDDPADVLTCNSYTLPALTNGNYFTLAGGPTAMGQIPLSAGNTITSSQTIYVYNETPHTNTDGSPGSCSIDNPVTITIVDTTVFQPVTECGSYTLPTITLGGYFTQPFGQGSSVDPNTPITNSQIVYYYVTTTTSPNCTDNVAINITINPRPAVDTLESRTYCGEYILPALTNGNYYMLSGGPTTVGQVALSAGNIIDLSENYLSPGTYYIFSGPDANGCTNESSFTVNIVPFPGLEQYINTIECVPYSIPAPPVGQIYTAPNGPNGSGTVVSPTTVFNLSQTFYLYYEDNVTGCRIDKEFRRIYKGINLPDFNDVTACDSYSLPPLTHLPPEPEAGYSIAYHFNDPSGPLVPAGYVFDPVNAATPQTICVYAVNADGHLINCSETKFFTVTVSETPVLPAMTFDPEECGSYTLPNFTPVNYNIGYYSSPGGVGLISPANYTFSTPGTYTVYVYATATNNPNCTDETQFTFTVYPLLDIIVPGGTICVDPVTNEATRTFTIQTGLNPALFSANWYLNGTLMGTGVNYTASVAGTYTIEFIKLTPEVGPDCNYNNTTVTIEQSSVAIASYTLSGAFEDFIDITVNIDGGYGEYMYQLEDGPIQASNVFTNVPAGEYDITIYDTLANCGTTVLTVTVLGYPNFFTPNGDGVNDFWNIKSLDDQPESYINIYDRFGKFLKQISPLGQGWDGTYNGEKLPSTDYWFQVFYTLNGQTKEFKAHFSMKR
ncbi:choice-of-anchor L domain-containing protein [Flavobacterium pedocola]